MSFPFHSQVSKRDIPISILHRLVLWEYFCNSKKTFQFSVGDHVKKKAYCKIISKLASVVDCELCNGVNLNIKETSP